MIKISGHNINPTHVSVVHTVPGTKKDRKYQIEIVMLSGYKFCDCDRVSESIVEAEDWADTLAKYIAAAAKQELIDATTATVKAAAIAASES